MVNSRAQSKGGRAEKLNRQFFPEKLVQASMPIPHRFLMMSKLGYLLTRSSSLASQVTWVGPLATSQLRSRFRATRRA